MQPAPRPLSLKFGPFTVDVRTGELRKNGINVRLQDKPLRVLVALAERQGEIVTREDLQKRLWADETFVDFETGLNTAVSRLREALSDNSEKPRYIETIHRRGYRFLAAVDAAYDRSELPTEASAAAGETSTEPQFSVGAGAAEASELVIHPKTALWMLTAVIAVFVASAFTIWSLTPMPEPRVLSIFPVTTTGKLDFYARPATDGVRIFYVERAGDHYDTMQASVNGGSEQKLDAPFRNTLIWDVSPDGSHYLMTSFEHRGEPAALWSWPATGSPPAKLGDLLSGSAAWSPDGKMIAFNAGHDLFLANADGTGKRLLRTFQEEPDLPVWSPDGTWICFTLNDSERDSHAIWEVRVDGSGLRPVDLGSTKPADTCCGSWTPDGRYFIFADTNADVPRIWALREKGIWWRRSPRGPFLLVSEPTGSFSPRIGQDGKHLYFYERDIKADLERMDVAAGTFSAFLPGTRPMMPSFSRDGQWIAYADLVTDVLYRRRSDSQELSEISVSGIKVWFPRWSPDGRKIAFTGQLPGRPTNAFIVPADGGRPEPVVQSSDAFNDPDWGPDGHTLVVVRTPSVAGLKNPKSVLDFIDLNDHRLTEIPGSEGLHLPRFSPDGRFLAAVADEGASLKIYDRAASSWRAVARGNLFGMPAWSADTAYLYFQDVLGPGEPLLRWSARSGKIEKVADFQRVLDGGVHRSVFETLAPDGSPIIGFQRGSGNIYGAILALP
jgi:Tol biopolymer transport system component/DNA-binding winged helix-turn-helix (wHTH) protein